MIAILLKNWKLFLDIILVVGAILVFTFLDPLGIFNNTKLQATANMVTGVRDIGQLVTAEYYGEVISSWKEFKLTEFPEDTVTNEAEDLFVELKFALSEVDNRFGNLYNETETNKLKSRYGEAFYFKFLTFLGEEYFGFDPERIFDEKDNDLKRNYEKKIWQKLYDKGKTYHKSLQKKYGKSEKELIAVEFDDYLYETPEFIDGFFIFHTALTQRHLESGSNKRKEIVFIGRGWVKAGFDFGELNEGNFMYDESNKAVHFFGIKPVILDTDINPWFIPERKIKGFELVDYSGRVNFEDAKAVKKQCKEKLLDQANRADIINKALENGEEALRSFFSLILDEPDIRVEFHTHPFDLHYAMIAADTLVDIKEALFIKELYQAQMKKLDQPGTAEERSMALKESQLMKYFIGQLKELYFIDSTQKFNFYSMTAAEILKDTFHISIADRQLLIGLRDTLFIDPDDTLKITTSIVAENPMWFGEDDFRYEFNKTMDALEFEAVSFDVETVCEVGNPLFDEKGYSIYYQNTQARQGDSILLNGEDLKNYQACDPSKNQTDFLKDIQFDMNYTLVLSDTLAPDTIAYVLNQYSETANYAQSFKDLNRAELATISIALQNKAVYEEKVDPLNRLVAGVGNFIDRIQKKD